jgi:hypothetical protein
MGRVATLPCAMTVVRCPSLPIAINTEKGENKKKGRKRKKKENQGAKILENERSKRHSGGFEQREK